jgi:hypothetical protein
MSHGDGGTCVAGGDPPTDDLPKGRTMNVRRPLSTPAKLNAAALAVTAGGILLQIASGSELYPTIPPGPIILLIGAGVVALGPWRWSPIIGLIVPVILLVGGTIAAVAGNEFLDQLTEPAEVGIFAGSVTQLLGLIAALVTGIVAVTRTSGASRTIGSSARNQRKTS